MRKIYALACTGFLASFLPILAQNSDNTAVNKNDRAKGSVTAGQQSNRKAAVRLTSDIRKSLIADKSLSTYAHNVKIINSNGVVVLKGPVRSQEEKAAVVAKAVEVAGAGKVQSELSVVPSKTVPSKTPATPPVTKAKKLPAKT